MRTASAILLILLAVSCGDSSAPRDTATDDDVLEPGDVPVGQDTSRDITPTDTGIDARQDITGDTAADIQPTDAVSEVTLDIPDAEIDIVIPSGCCLDDGDCAGERCVFPQGDRVGVCGEVPGDGRCWTDDDCDAGETCHGRGVCGCYRDCDMAYEGPGVCAAENATCVTVDPSDIREICDAASMWVFDGQACVSTCAGCCGCEPWCEFTFETQQECETACGFAPLTITLDTQGGFTAMGGVDYSLVNGILEIYSPFDTPETCSGTLDRTTLASLYAAVDEIDFSTLADGYRPPQNPSCCCDQFVYFLAVAAPWAMNVPATGQTTWCDESLLSDLVPNTVVNLVGILEQAGQAVRAGCQQE